MRKSFPEATFRRLDIYSVNVVVVLAFKLYAMKLRAPYQGVNQASTLLWKSMRDDFFDDLHKVARLVIPES